VTRPTRTQIARLVRRQLLSSRPTLLTILIGLAGPLLLVAMYVGVASRTPPSAAVAAIFALGPSLSLFLLFGVPAASLRHPAMKDLLEHGLQYRFSGASVFMRGPHGASDLEWSAFGSAFAMGDFYALRLAAGTAFIIPRAAFASATEEQGFLALVREKLGAKAKL